MICLYVSMPSSDFYQRNCSTWLLWWLFLPFQKSAYKSSGGVLTFGNMVIFCTLEILTKCVLKPWTHSRHTKNLNHILQSSLFLYFVLYHLLGTPKSDYPYTFVSIYTNLCLNVVIPLCITMYGDVSMEKVSFFLLFFSSFSLLFLSFSLFPPDFIIFSRFPSLWCWCGRLRFDPRRRHSWIDKTKCPYTPADRWR